MTTASQTFPHRAGGDPGPRPRPPPADQTGALHTLSAAAPCYPADAAARIARARDAFGGPVLIAAPGQVLDLS